jgi:hypothetical protein
MRKTKTLLATLAIGIAFAGPAFAEKMKATLDGKSESPPNASAGKGTADVDYDAATKKLTWKLTYSGLSGPPTAAHFSWSRRTRQERQRRRCDPESELKPGRRQCRTDRRASRRPDGRQVLHQRPHRGRSGRRNSRPGDQVGHE